MATVVNPTVATFTAPTKYRAEDGGGTIPATGPGAIARYKARISTAANPSLRIITDTDLTPTNGKQSIPIPQDLPLGDYNLEVESETAEGGIADYSAKVPFLVAAKRPETIVDLAVG